MAATTTRVRTVTSIPVPAAGGDASPEKLSISFFDNFFVSFPSMKTVFLYPSPSVPFSAVVDSLKKSLSLVLPLYRAFGGTLTRDADGVVSIDCSDASVAFIEAETDLDFAAFVGKSVHDLGEFSPFAAHVEIGKLPAPVMSVQATEFTSGGMALAVTLHHGAADGSGLWLFIDLWRQACRSGAMPPVPRPPVHDRSGIIGVPSVENARVPCLHQDIAQEGSARLARKKFFFDAEMIRGLKQQLAPHNSGMPPSTFSALTAHCWVSLARTKDLMDNAGPVGLMFIVDCRSRLTPPVDGQYTGNCVFPGFVKLSAAEVAGAEAFPLAYRQIKEVIAAVNVDAMKYYESISAELMQHPVERMVLVTGSPKFQVYENDFGFGLPEWVEMSSVDHGCEVSYAAGKAAGVVEATVTLPRDEIEAFAATFGVKEAAGGA